MKNKVITSILVASMLAVFLCSCDSLHVGSKSATPQPETVSDGAKLNVVCTVFPQYDWVLQILGEQAKHVNLTLLLDNGVDLHSFQPTAEDIVKVSEADLFIYVGGESDAWVHDVLASAKNKNMIALNLMDLLAENVKQEEIAEGMQAAHASEEGKDAQAEIEYDEHVWLSIKNAMTICNSIADALGSLDKEHADLYHKNCEVYVKQLSALDAEYKQTVSTAARTTLLFGDRFPFRYLVDDYDLTYFAAFVGCSAETEASFKTVTFLAGKVDELALPVVLALEDSDQKIAQTIINNTEAKDQKILVMDSLQSVTSRDLAAGKHYLASMKENLNVLREALN